MQDTQMTKEEYLQNILGQLEEKKEQNKRGLFRIGEKIDFNTAYYVRDYFKDNPNYTIDVHSCGGCKSKVWDIVILFRGN